MSDQHPPLTREAFLAAIRSSDDGLTNYELALIFGLADSPEKKRVWSMSDGLVGIGKIVRAGQRKVAGAFKPAWIWKLAPEGTKPPDKSKKPKETTTPLAPVRAPSKADPEPLCCPTCRRTIDRDEAYELFREGTLVFATEDSDEGGEEE